MSPAICRMWRVASAKWPVRHLAITGTETALMIWSIMSGSLIRATPPSALMSAGTRSSAMTATAPASSAIFACSGVTTSMITPPLSMSAIPRLTPAVPVTGAIPELISTLWLTGADPAAVASPARPPSGLAAGCPGLAAELVAGTMNLTRLLADLSMVGAPGAPAPGPSRRPGQPQGPHRSRRPHASAGPGGRRVARGEVRHVRAAPGGVPIHQGLIDLEELGPGGTPGQAEQPDQPPAPRGPGGGDRVVVELAGQEHLVCGGFEFRERLVPAAPRRQAGPESRLAQRRPQGAGQIAFRPLVRPARTPCVGRAARDGQAGRRVEQAAGGQFEGDGTTPDQRRVERGPRRLDPRVEPVQPPGPPRHVDADQDRGHDDDDHAGQHGTTPPSAALLPSRGAGPGRAVTVPPRPSPPRAPR